MNRNKKIVLNIFLVIILLLILSPMVLIEVVYETGLSWIHKPLPIPCGVKYSRQIQEAIWYGHGETGAVHVVPEWP